MNSSSDRIAGGAFVSAVAKTLQIEEEILKLRAELQEADANAARANEAAMRELGFSEATTPMEVFAAQEDFLERAIAQAALPASSPVPGAVRRTLQEARDKFEMAMNAEAAQLGRMQGPTL